LNTLLLPVVLAVEMMGVEVVVQEVLELELDLLLPQEQITQLLLVPVALVV
jgi:hypothetical protein